MIFWSVSNCKNQKAKELCNELIVGTHLKEEILQAKGIEPIYSFEERAEILKNFKWVDNVVQCPYTPIFDEVINHNVDLVLHGSDHVGVYGKFIKANMYK